MDKLRRLTPLAILCAAPPAAATTVDDWAAQIHEASERFGIPEQWIREVMRAESDGRTRINGQPTTSPTGAMGLMQLMAGTWTDMRRTYRLGSDPYDPRDNVLAGSAYLRAMVDRFGYPAALAAYNAGPARLAEFLAKGRPLPPETVSYVERATGSRRSRGKFTSRGPASSRKAPVGSLSCKLFFVRREIRVGAKSARAGGLDALFAIHRDSND